MRMLSRLTAAVSSAPVHPQAGLQAEMAAPETVAHSQTGRKLARYDLFGFSRSTLCNASVRTSALPDLAHKNHSGLSKSASASQSCASCGCFRFLLTIFGPWTAGTSRDCFIPAGIVPTPPLNKIIETVKSVVLSIRWKSCDSGESPSGRPFRKRRNSNCFESSIRSQC